LLHRLDFIYDLFEKVGSRNNEEKMGTARRKPTVSSQFRVSDLFTLYNREQGTLNRVHEWHLITNEPGPRRG